MQLHWFWFYVNSFLIGSKNMMSIIIIIIVVPLPITSEVLFPGGGRILSYMGHTGMCCCEGYGFQAVYSCIGYINQSVWV